MLRKTPLVNHPIFPQKTGLPRQAPGDLGRGVVGLPENILAYDRPIYIEIDIAYTYSL